MDRPEGARLVECPHCGYSNSDNARFCGECATPLGLPSSCPSCGTRNLAGQKYCNACGQPLTAAAAVERAPGSYTPKRLAEKILQSKSALEGERKQVTVLFADLKGSMELIADRDPEEARTILDPVLERMMEAVHRYEGTVSHVMGDGIMALFGAPLAHEDLLNCRRCHAANRAERRFCAECGAPLAIGCAGCGFDNEPGEQFCGGCGAGLAPPPSSPAGPREPAPAEAERRQLTVMFCDLVGSTELASRLDPEELREIVRVYREASASEVERFEGFVAKSLGDGLLVYFGYPQAHEDDAARAIHAGLGIVAAMAGLNAGIGVERGVKLAVRIGIATGLVVVGRLSGERVVEEHAIVGDKPSLAARLQAVAEPDSVVLVPATHHIAERLFECADLGALQLKGFPEPVRAWRVLRPRRAESPFAASEVPTPLVSREDEIDLLLRRWHRARDGEGQVVLLSGEPGIGKSRIVQALGERVAGEPHARLLCQCSPYHTNSMLHPVIAQLERAARFEGDDTDARKLDKLEALLGRSTSPVATVAPLLAALLLIPAGDRYPPLDSSPQERKQRTLEALADQLCGRAAREPVLLLLEDAHWSDPTTLELTDLLVAAAPSRRVLVLVTFRPEFTAPWAGSPSVTSLVLNRLGRMQAARIAVDVSGDRSLPSEILEEIVARTDGVPLFVEELTKAVLESGLLVAEGDRYRLAGPLPPLAIPPTLQDSLMARLDRLGAAKEVAQTAAAIGREFSHELLVAVSVQPEESLEPALARLLESGLVFRRGLPPAASYTFKHSLVQEAAYGSLLKTRRQQLHQQIAAALEERFPAVVEKTPELVAHHLGEAGLAGRAAALWLQAARLASQRSADVEAIADSRKGLALIARLPDTPERDRLELDLLCALGPALMATKGYTAPEVGAAYGRAQRLCGEGTAPTQAFAVNYGLWANLFFGGRLAAARELAADALALARQQSDPAILLQGHHVNWSSLLYAGDFAPCLEHARRGIALYDFDEHRHHAFLYGGHDPGMCCRVTTALSLWFLGAADQALASGRDAVALAHRLAHPFSEVIAVIMLAHLHRYRGELDRTREAAEAVIRQCADRRIGSVYAAWATILEGWALAAGGAGAEGLARVREGMDAWRATGSKNRWPMVLAALADTLRRLGQSDEALAVLDDARTRLEGSGEEIWRPEIEWLRGETLDARSPGDAAEAVSYFSRARDVALALGTRSWELRAVTSLARVHARQGRGEEARPLLAPVYRQFSEGLDTVALREARALLDELG